MSQKMVPHNGRRFFLAFQRYIQCASFTAPRNAPNHAFHLRYSQRPDPHSSSLGKQRRYQSTIAASQPSSPPPRTHYDLFPQALARGAPPSGPFPIDLQALKREFLQLQGKAHPDRHTGANKSRAEGTSALINEAYKTLQDPLLRAQYLLSLHGIDVAEDETAKIDDPELLGEVLEVRETLESAENEGEIESLKTDNEARLEESVKLVGEQCEAGDWQGAKSEAVKLRYWVNIKEAIRDWEPGKPVVLVH